jgi:hypothetical protein
MDISYQTKPIKQRLHDGGALPSRYVKLANNYFSKAANASNSSESASPGAMDLANKTLYLLEELDTVAIAESKLKLVVSMDDGRARALYGENQTVKHIGHLMINANNPPKLGQDPAVWDRTIYIPWDAKYIGEGYINAEKGIFRRNKATYDRLVTLSSALLTVCLTEFTTYLKENPEATTFPVPECVSDLIATEKQKISPVPVFLEKHLFKAQGARSLTVETLHAAFHGFCRLRITAARMDYQAFHTALTKTKYELVTDVKSQLVVKDYDLNEAGAALGQNESLKRGIISADNMDIPHLFKRQRMQM